MLLCQVPSRALYTSYYYEYNELIPIAVISLRMTSYASQNVALTLNIGRWALILRSFSAANSINNEGNRVSQGKVWTWIIIFSLLLVLQSCAFGALELLKVQHATVLRRYTQACLINPALIVCFIVVYWRIQRIFRSREIIIFFIAIIQYLAALSTDLMVSTASDDSLALDRLSDIVSIAYQFSSIALFFGVSLSIRKAADVERHSYSVRSEDDSIFAVSNDAD